MNVKILSTDCLIIGAGGSAFMAAHAFKQHNEKAKVMLLGIGSGATPYVHGFNVPIGSDDSVEIFIKDTMISGNYLNDESLVRILCKDSLQLLEDLQNLGIEFNKIGKSYELLRALGCSKARLVSSGNTTGAQLITKIRQLYNDTIDFRQDMHMVRLCAIDGCIHGALAFNEQLHEFICIKAPVIILATGGFCNLYPFSTNTSDIAGDGLAGAFFAGADLIDLEFIQFEPTVATYPPSVRGKGVITTLIHQGATIRNALGDDILKNSFLEGSAINKDKMAQLIYKEIQEGHCTTDGSVFFDATNVPQSVLDTSYHLYMERYRQAGIDFSTTAVPIAPGAHTSLGGVKINPDCSTKVKNLYACGEVIGGLHGSNRLGGNAGLEILVFGKIAGTSASHAVYDNTISDNLIKNWSNEIFESLVVQDNDNLTKMRSLLQQHLNESLNVVREGVGLQKTSDILSEILHNLAKVRSYKKNSAQSMFKTMRLYNDVTTAYLLTTSALKRTDSSGSHMRSDYPNISEVPYNLIIKGPFNYLDVMKKNKKV